MWRRRVAPVPITGRSLRRSTAFGADTVEDTAEIDPGRWCRVDLFGHDVRFGLVRDVEYAGRRWLEITEPENVEDVLVISGGSGIRTQREIDRRTVPERRKLYHPNAVYASRPMTRTCSDA